MIVSLIAPSLNDAVVRQVQFLTADGHECHLYIQDQETGQGCQEVREKLATILESDHGHDSTLFLFHFIDQPYPLLAGVNQIHHGTVILDLRASAIFDQAPVHFADFCLVSDVAQKQALHDSSGFALERIYIVSEQGNCEECFGATLNRMVQGSPASLLKPQQPFDEDDLASLFVLPDPAVDVRALLSDIAESCRHRWGEGGSDLDMTTMGPEALRPSGGATEHPEKADVEELLWNFRVALDDLISHARLIEPEFHSIVPVFGPFIAAVRRFWNTISTKWYVIGWMNQQAKFNVAAVDLVYALLKLQESNEQRLRCLESELHSPLIEAEKEHTA
ncbi:MAG: hypothetical protein JW963_24070 [Anaerolineales bacterium]|nr:hypothetical protein [Anaerolineales bacterium]